MPKNSESDNVPEIYQGRTAALLATGPTLFDEHIEQIKPYHDSGQLVVFGCNDAYKICDFIDVFYACDPKWWDANPESYALEMPKWTQDTNLARRRNKGIKWIRGQGGNGLCLKKHQIYYGGNSGFQMLNLAYHYGVRHFILLGYTMTVPKGFEQHFFGTHPKGLNQSKNSYRSFVGAYQKIQPDIKKMIVNCTPQSHLGNIFRNELLEDELRYCFENEPRPDTNWKPTEVQPRKRNVQQKAQRRTRKTNGNGNKAPAKVQPESKPDKPIVQRGNRNYSRNRSIIKQRAERLRRQGES
jgi:hypothetical protein